MSDEYPLYPLPMLELPNISRWTPERLAEYARFIERLEGWIPYELVETAVSRFVENTIDEILRKPHREEHRDLIKWIASQLENDGRPNVHRVLDQIILNAIGMEGINPVRPVADRGWVWSNFIHLEARYLCQQFVLLWLDILTYARMHYSLWGEPVPLSALLIPNGKVVSWMHPGFKPSFLGRFELKLSLQNDREWRDEFYRLLLSACCTLSGDLFNIHNAFKERVKQEIEEACGLLTLLEVNGGMLSIRRSTDGIDTMIAPLKPVELEAWGIGKADSQQSDQPMKPAPWMWIVKRLHEISTEYTALEREIKAECKSDLKALSRITELSELESEARILIELLQNCDCIPSQATNARDDIAVALRTMASVLPEYEDDWRESILDEIFANDS